MDAWFKWMLGAILLLAIGVIGLCWGIHAYGASSLRLDPAPNTYRVPQSIREQYLGAEYGNISSVPKFNPASIWWNIYRSGDDEVLRHQIQLLDRASRLAFSREPSPSSQLRYHAGSIAGTVILSRKWSFDDIVDTTIGESWYGRDARGMEAASLAYFGVRLAQLSEEESLALIVLLHSPSYYDPMCRRERFEDRYSILATRLKMDSGPAGLHKATSRMLPLPCH